MNEKVLKALKEGGLGAGINTAASIIPNSMQMAELPQNGGQQAIDALYSRYSTSDSMSDLQNLFDSTQLAKTDYNWRDVMGMSDGQAAGNIIGSGLSGASAGMAAGPIGGAVGGLFGLISSGFSYLARKRKAQREAARLNREGALANEVFMDNFSNSIDNAMTNNRNQSLLNIAAFGGHLDNTFTNGVRFITEGGSHEQNPFGGVLQGIASDGLPNLVEEGEVIFNDYVFSRRLNVPDADKEKLGLKKDKDYTFAEAAEFMQRESEERPNDYYSKNTLKEMMGRLQGSQEALKEKRDGQALKRAINKMTPDELAMFMQQLQQPQQMQPMQPTQSEVSMFAKGGLLGHRFDDESKLTHFDFGYDPYLMHMWDVNVKYPTTKLESPIGAPVSASDILSSDSFKKIAEEAKNIKPTVNNNNYTSSFAQALRAAPIFGSAIGALSAFMDKPNYSNIARAERAMAAVPRVSAGTVGQKLTYNPVDINYIAASMNNQAIGARRAAIEGSLGNSAAASGQLIALNYGSQTALGNALIQAQKENADRKAQVAGFNRETDSFNIQNSLRAAMQNQEMDARRAYFLMQTGQLRDQELARIQANRSAALTNLFQNIGNYGQDMLAREQVKAALEAGVFSEFGDNKNNFEKTLGTVGGKHSKGGHLYIVKKGGKHA